MIVDWDEWKKMLIYPQVKMAVSLMARVAIIALWAGFISGLLVLLGICGLAAFYQVIPENINAVLVLFFRCSHLFTLLLCTCLGLLLPWCHTVLLYQQGWDITRALSWLPATLAVFVLIAEPLFLMTGIRLFDNQSVAPIIIMLLMEFIIIMNLTNMRALHWARRTSLVLLPPLLIICLVLSMYGDPIISTILRLIILLIALQPLRLLQKNAPRIVGLPEVTPSSSSTT